MSRLIKECLPDLQEKAGRFTQRMIEAGIPFMFTSTRRTKEEQAELYARGRNKTPGPIVTWSRKSKHLEGKAFDIAILREGKPCWDTKVSVNGNTLPDYEEAGRIGESVGLHWGGRFKDRKGRPRPDYPHFEIA